MKETIFLFTGQGSQQIGMGKELVRNSLKAKQLYQEASFILDLDLEELCFGKKTELLSQTKYAQIAIAVYEYALYSDYIQKHALPTSLAGHSLGELVALTASGAINFSDLVLIAYERGKAMQQSANIQATGMVATIGDSKTLIRLSEKYPNIYVANYNSTNQIVFSGIQSELERFERDVENIGGVPIQLKVNGGFHSPLMQNAAIKYKTIIDSFVFDIPYIPVYSNVTGELYSDDVDVLKELLVRQVTTPVKWVNIVSSFIRGNVQEVLEFGPKKILLNFIPDSKKYIKRFIGNEN